MLSDQNRRQLESDRQPPRRSAPLLSYDVPQQVGVSGRHYIELDLDRTDFRAQQGAYPEETPR